MQQAGDHILNTYNLEGTFNVQLPDVKNWLDRKIANSAVKITDTSKANVSKELQASIDAGLGIDDMAKRITGLFEETYKNRSRTIARTEVISANNKASTEAAKQGGMTHKIWLTALDERTRESHAIANGQKILINQPFIVDGEQLNEPGDAALGASASNLINCRCTVIFDVE